MAPGNSRRIPTTLSFVGSPSNFPIGIGTYVRQGLQDIVMLGATEFDVTSWGLFEAIRNDRSLLGPCREFGSPTEASTYQSFVWSCANGSNAQTEVIKQASAPRHRTRSLMPYVSSVPEGMIGHFMSTRLANTNICIQTHKENVRKTYIYI